MKPADFDLSGAIEVHWDLDIRDDETLGSIRHHLKEDLIQITFGDVVVDVGWYPEFSPNGCFRTYVVVNEDWERPVRVIESRTISDLRNALKDALAEARRALGSPVGRTGHGKTANHRRT